MKIQTFLLTMFLFVGSVAAEVTTNILDGDSGALTVWVNSSAPALPPNGFEKKPEWKDGTNAFPGSQSIWYPLEARTNNLRIGGYGDQYVGFLKFPLALRAGAVKKATLLLFCEDDPDRPDRLLNELEVRTVTSPFSDRIRFSNLPSSRFYSHVKVKPGYIEIDVTSWVNDALEGPPYHYGLRFSHVDRPQKEKFVKIHGPYSKNPPKIIFER